MKKGKVFAVTLLILVLELCLATLLIGLESLVCGTALGVGGDIVGLHIGGRIGRGSHLHRLDCHSETGICTQQSRGNHKEG